MCNQSRGSAAGLPNGAAEIMNHPKSTPTMSLELTGHAEAGLAPVQGDVGLRQCFEAVSLGSRGAGVHRPSLIPSDATCAHGFSSRDLGTLTIVDQSQLLNPQDWSQDHVLQWLRRVLSPTPEEVFQRLGSPRGAVLCTLKRKEMKERVGGTTGALVHDKFLDEFYGGGVRAPLAPADLTGTDTPHRTSDPALAALIGNISRDLDTLTIVDQSQLLNPRDWSQGHVLQWLRRVLSPTPEEVFQRLGLPSGAVLCTLKRKEIEERVGGTMGALVHDKFLDEFSDGRGRPSAPPSQARSNLPLPETGSVTLLYSSNEKDQFSRPELFAWPYPVTVECPGSGSGVGGHDILQEASERMFVAPTLAPSTALIPMDTATAATSEATPAEPLRSRGGRPRRPPGIPPRARARRRPRARAGERTSGRGSLWKFILKLLLKPRYNPSIIRWEDMERGLFYFENGEEVARLRGEETQNPNKEGYGYAFMSKAMRTGNGYFTKCKEGEENVRRKFFYFGPKASWREEMARILDGCGEVSDNTLTPPNCSSDKSTRGSCC